MKPTAVEHIGIAVKNLAESVRFYENLLGSKCYAIEEVKDQKVRTAFFKIGSIKIELLESTEPGGPIGKFISKKGEGLHHIAFAVGRLDDALAEMEAAGVRLIDKAPRSGGESLRIAFLHPESTGGVLIELCSEA